MPSAPSRIRGRAATTVPGRRSANKTKGLPKSVIPEYVDKQIAFKLSAPLTLTWDYFPSSLFSERRRLRERARGGPGAQTRWPSAGATGGCLGVFGPRLRVRTLPPRRRPGLGGNFDQGVSICEL